MDPSPLYELFMYWYGFNKVRRDVCEYRVHDSAVREQWDQVWFSKTKQVDQYIAAKFGHLVDVMTDHEPQNSIETLGKMVLYDQVVRNVYRNTARAYQYDHIALKLAHGWLQDGVYRKLPLFAKLTVILCLIHSEVGSDQQWAEDELLLLRVERQQDGLMKTLLEISSRHKTRVEVFGRLPERARIRGLTLSAAEKIFLDNVC